MNALAQLSGTFTDSRNGKTYKTIEIGSQTWMTENFNYISKCGGKCYNDNSTNCTKYGRLYDIETAITSSPAGWHLPSIDDILTLVEFLGGSSVTVPDTLDNEEPYISHILLENVYEELIQSLNLKAGGRFYEDTQFEYFDLGRAGLYWLYSSPKTSVSWYLDIDFSKKAIGLYWLDDIIQNPKNCSYGFALANGYSVLYLKDEQSGIQLGNLGWHAYEWGDIDKAIEYSKKSLELDKTLGWIHANLGLFYLIKGNISLANESYASSIIYIKQGNDAKYDFESVIDDINNAIGKYPSIKGSSEILKKLQAEYDKL